MTLKQMQKLILSLNHNT